MRNLHEFETWLSTKNSGSHHRQFLLLDLPLTQGMAILEAIIAHFNCTSLMTNNLEIANTQKIKLSRYQDYLGHQSSALIFDALSGFNLNALYAGAGMVSHKGLVVILLPQKKEFNMPTSALKYNYGNEVQSDYFTPFFVRLSKQYNAAYVNEVVMELPSSEINASSGSVAKREINNNENATFCAREFLVQETKSIKPALTLSSMQSKIYEKITTRLIESHSNNTALKQNRYIDVILGARGRGKSTLLAAIAHKLLSTLSSEAKPITLVACSLSKHQLNTFFKALGRFHFINGMLRPQESAGSQLTVKYYAPDEIINQAPKNALVFIDEVASIAPSLLKQICAFFPHCVLTGTSSGYEGSGKGFVQRLLPFLTNHYATEVYQLSESFRWLPGDYVEGCLNHVLGLLPIGTFKHTSKLNPSALSSIQHEIITKKELISDDHLYQQVFALLNEAHYQTNPNDIVRTLDAEECEIAVSYHSTKSKIPLGKRIIIAVAILFTEGGKTLEPIAQDISLGKRRVQGHLTPQALSMFLYSTIPCCLRYLRVNRIAVLSDFRKQEFGSKLLSFCLVHGKRQNYDYLSVSFGYTPALYPFWQKNRFILAKYGHRIDTASGTASVLMLKQINDTTKIDNTYLQLRLAIEQQYLLEHDKRLSEIYAQVFKQNSLMPRQSEVVYNTNLNLALQNYLNEAIDIEKVLPILCSLTNDAKSQSKKDGVKRELHDQLMAYTMKGQHKHIKQELSFTIRKLLKSVLDGEA